MLSSSGPANIPGNSVSTAIFICLPPTKSNPASMGGRFFNDFECATQTLLCTTREQQRPNRVNRHPLPANDLAHILRMQPQFINRRPLPLDRRHDHVIEMLYQPFDDVFEKGLHGRGVEWVKEAKQPQRRRPWTIS